MMCTVCGCADGEGRIEGHAAGHEHDPHHHDHGNDASSSPPAEDAAIRDATHRHDHVHADGDHVHYGRGPARAHAPGLSQARMVQIEQDILGKNDQYAAANRRLLVQQGVLTLNLLSSPGSGKTSLLTRTLHDLQHELTMTVIEGDQETSNDAARIRATGARAIQINTGKGCHLDAHQVGHAIDQLQPEPGSVLFIENVGNLVCPAAFDLGEACKVAVLSITEGEDKPLKYPDMFRAADLLLLNKIDLLPHLRFDVERCVDYARRVNPGLQVFELSAISGEGLNDWYAWLRATRAARLVGHPLMHEMAETPDGR